MSSSPKSPVTCHGWSITSVLMSKKCLMALIVLDSTLGAPGRGIGGMLLTHINCTWPNKLTASHYAHSCFSGDQVFIERYEFAAAKYILLGEG